MKCPFVGDATFSYPKHNWITMTMFASRASGLRSPSSVYLLHIAAHPEEAGKELTLQTVGWVLPSLAAPPSSPAHCSPIPARATSSLKSISSMAIGLFQEPVLQAVTLLRAMQPRRPTSKCLSCLWCLTYYPFLGSALPPWCCCLGVSFHS